MQALSAVCERIGATSKKTEKVSILADYFRSRSVDEAGLSAVFLSGRVFPASEETTLQVGGAMLSRTVASLSPGGEAAVASAYRKYGDLGAAAEEVLAGTASPPEGSGLGVLELEAELRAIAAMRGPAAKSARLREVLSRATPVEAKYIVKIISSDLRIGLKESLVEEAIAKAYEAPLAAVHRAGLLLGDIGATLRLAAAGTLGEARMRLFHPLGFMLASPAETAEEAFSSFAEATVEDKYDGIRAQAHCGGEEEPGKARLFSRTLDDVTGAFPEIARALAELPEPAILDGEVLALRIGNGEGEGRALPFSELQKRLGRKAVTEEMMRAVPVAYVVFDVLYVGGRLLLDAPLREREAALDSLFARPRLAPKAPPPRAAGARRQLLLPLGDDAPAPEPERRAPLIRAPVRRAGSVEDLEALFLEARARGNEGLMIKDPSSTYTPGRRGGAWLKLKQELATLDVVVTAVELGHGKRAGVLSDYTFAVRDGERLLTIGKAYSGLTDVEIAELNAWFLEHTIEDQGHRRVVQPRVVVEVAFNNMMESSRHESGYALRFPRIVRVRTDKSTDDIDTLAAARAIFERQSAP